MRVLLFILIASHVQEFSAQSSSAKDEGPTHQNYFNPYFNSYPHIPTEIIDVGENGLPLARSGTAQYANNYASLPRLGEPLNLDGAKQVSQMTQGGQQYYPYPYNAGFPFNGYYNIPGTNPGAGTANVQYPNYYQGLPGNIYGTNQYFAGNHLPLPPPKFPPYTITETKKKYQFSNTDGRKRVVTSTFETLPVQTKISRYIDGRTGELKVDIQSSGNGKSVVVVAGDGVDDVDKTLPSRETTTEQRTTTQGVTNDVNNTKPDDVFSWFT